MADIETLIQGSQKLIDIFGYWPSFHDAEIIELHIWRGDVDPEQKRYVFPLLTVQLHTWELTNEVDERGFFILRNHTLTKIRFHDVNDFKMEKFNHQNAILELQIEQKERIDGPSPFFVVEFTPAFGMSATFSCFRIEVLEALRCEKDGKVHGQH